MMLREFSAFAVFLAIGLAVLLDHRRSRLALVAWRCCGSGMKGSTGA